MAAAEAGPSGEMGALTVQMVLAWRLLAQVRARLPLICLGGYMPRAGGVDLTQGQAVQMAFVATAICLTEPVAPVAAAGAGPPEQSEATAWSAGGIGAQRMQRWRDQYEICGFE